MKARSTDELIQALRALDREEADDALADPRWDALTEGTATSDDVAALRDKGEHDPLAREAIEVFQPLGEGAERRYAAAIAAEIAASRAKKAARGAGEPTVDAAPPAVSPANDTAAPVLNGATPSASPEHDASAKIVPLPRTHARGRVSRWIAATTTAVAIAAAVALVMIRQPGTDEMPALPGYALTVAAGEATSRGEPDEDAPLLRPGSRVVLTLRPETPASGPIGARAFLVQGDRVEAVAADAQTSPDGAVRLVGRLGATLGAAPGDAELVVIVARPDALPAPDAGRAALAESAKGRQIVRRKVRIDGAR